MIVRDSYFDDLDDDDFFMHMPVGSTCFLCGKKLSLPCVMWNGCASSGIRGHHPDFGETHEAFQIWLHPQCVEDLFRRMLRDVEEIETRDRETATARLRRWKAQNAAD